MRRLLLIATLLVATPLAAQSGTTTWAVSITIPDSMQMMAQGISEVDMRMILATDGHRVAMQIEPGPKMLARSTATDLSGARLQAIINAAADSVALGVVLPPAMAEMMGGAGIGYRLDLPLDSLKAPSRVADSLRDRVIDSSRTHPIDTGERETVAGIPCEVWRAVDSTGSTVTMCLAAAPAGLKALSDVMKRNFPKLADGFEKIGVEMRKEFGGRDLVAIRMELSGGQQMRMELQSTSTDAPDPSFFMLPLDLQPFPLETFKAMMPTPAEPTDSTGT